MKRLLILGALAFLSFPLLADEKKTAAESSGKTTAASATPASSDSPLVAAAKRSKRATSKRTVITDETVKTAKGHVTTTDSTYSPKLSEKIEPSAEVVANEKRAKERAEAEKRANEERGAAAERQRELARKARLAEQAEQAEDGYEDDVDPAQLERDIAAAAAEKKPQR